MTIKFELGERVGIQPARTYANAELWSTGTITRVTKTLVEVTTDSGSKKRFRISDWRDADSSSEWNRAFLCIEAHALEHNVSARKKQETQRARTELTKTIAEASPDHVLRLRALVAAFMVDEAERVRIQGLVDAKLQGGGTTCEEARSASTDSYLDK
jgi:hypothetical protein